MSIQVCLSSSNWLLSAFDVNQCGFFFFTGLFTGKRRSLADFGQSGSGEGSAGMGIGGADFLEIDAIPPLPLFALLTADDGKAAAAASRDADGARRKNG